jgi:outer membrane protein OmpA-like peptidoglycan-associated protein
MRNVLVVCVLAASACASAPARPLALRRIVLYQNGIGHFEHEGRPQGERFRVWVKQYEVDDVIKTLTVIDRDKQARTVAAVLPRRDAGAMDRVAIEVVLSGPARRELSIAYAVPTPTWKATYRVALDDEDQALLQAWAMVDNVTSEPWRDVKLTLATGAPMSFASDLRTPRFVDRPDATGRMVAPTALAPVGSERARPGDRDGDGVADASDVCPADAEDRDTFEDDDGCPDADNDRDAIPDAVDRCPTETESWNGMDDDDGCPDRGRMIVNQSEIRIYEKIYFAHDAVELGEESSAILDAIAATLRANPEIETLTIAGHAGDNERDPWGLAAQRAAAVRAALLQRGVQARLELRPFGDTQPLSGGKGIEAQAPNRRVELEIARAQGQGDAGGASAGTGGAPSAPASTPTARALEDSVHTSSVPRQVAGAVRYELEDPVTLPAGSSTLVSIINERVGGEDVLLYRPDAAVPGSDTHPLRAARLVNQSGLALEPGPVAVFSRGAFVGEGLLDRLPRGETAFIPYALDGSTWVRVEVQGGEEPGRLVSIARGVFTVENREVRTTRYEIAAGVEPAARMFVKHTRTPGYGVGELPPGTVEAEGAWLIPIPLTASRLSVLTVTERRPVRRSVRLLESEDPSLALILEGSELSDALRLRLTDAIALRRQAGRLEMELAALRRRLGDAAARGQELRDSLKAIERSAGAAALRKKILDRLGDVIAVQDETSRALAARTIELGDARAKLADALAELTLEE